MEDVPEFALAKRGKPRQKTNRHGYVGEWTEPKLLTIYVVDAQGQRVNTAELPVTNDGTFVEAKPFMQLLEMHLVRLGINQADQVLLVADGAPWIWQRIPPLLQRLGCPPESILELLDFYHVTEHLHAFAEAAFTNPVERQAWFKQARKDLKQGRVGDLRIAHESFDKKDSRRPPPNDDCTNLLLDQRPTTGAVELLPSGGYEVTNW